MPIEPHWEPDREWPTATHAERARVGTYELIVVQIAADGAWPEEIRWEIYDTADRQTPVITGEADAFEQAKLDAAAALKTFNDRAL